MWHPDRPYLELILRGIIVYAFLLTLIRITGKRQVGQLAPFDLILLLVLSNAVQNAMNGGDNSIVGGLTIAVTLVVMNYAVAFLTYRSKTLAALIEGRPIMLVHDGCVKHDGMTAARLTIHELNAALRAEGCTIEDCHYAVLENNGRVSVIQKKNHNHANGAQPQTPAPGSPGNT
jgi:uncharacterized membrane protein YcaP (DUF421 family)